MRVAPIGERELDPKPPAKDPPPGEPPVREPRSEPARKEPPTKRPPLEAPPDPDRKRDQPDPSSLAPTLSCIVCGSTQLSELVGFEELAQEAVHRADLLRDMFPPGTPEYMLKDRAYATQTYDARVVSCDECGTLARDPHLTQLGARAEYSNDSYHPDWLESSYRELRAAFSERIPELGRSLRDSARVLEVGSFAGGFLAAAQDYGWHARGIDVGECVTRFARGKGLDVQTGVLSEARFPARSFDAVFVWFCFEQLHQPWLDLAEIYRILDDGGRLFVRVPNGAFVRWMEGVQGHAPLESLRESARKCLAVSGLAAFPFQLGYTPASLRRILRESGFDSVSLRNQINLRGSDPNRQSFWSVPSIVRTLRCVHAGSQVLHHATLGFMTSGPWIEASCVKTAVRVASGSLMMSRFAEAIRDASRRRAETTCWCT